MKQKIISNFSPLSWIFFSILFFILFFICNLIFEESKILSADETSDEKTIFLAFDMNYKNQEELETSKDIINQILKYYSKEPNTELVFQRAVDQHFAKAIFQAIHAANRFAIQKVAADFLGVVHEILEHALFQLAGVFHADHDVGQQALK